MIKYDSESDLEKTFGDIAKAIDGESAVGYITVTDVPEDKFEVLKSEFRKGGFWVSERTFRGKVVILWSEPLIDGFVKSGYRFV